MNLYTIKAFGPYPARYRGLLGENADQAIAKAAQRHHDAGFWASHYFTVASCHPVVCDQVVENPDEQHAVHFGDALLAEVELALLERIAELEGQYQHAIDRHLVRADVLAQRLKRSREALARVLAA